MYWLDSITRFQSTIPLNWKNQHGCNLEDPKLGSLQDNGGLTQTHAPAFDSPVIDTGNPDPSSLPPTDQRRLARVMGSRVDMGAVESAKIFLPALGK